MQNDVEFARFVRRREVLSERLDMTRADLDAWIQRHAELVPSAAELAQLEGLLAIRTDLFGRLKELDEGLMEYLLRLRSSLPDTADSVDDEETALPS
jgi:hypothetical protein